jgi:thioredoxin 1
MAEDNPDAVFVKVDVDDAEDIAGHFGIQAMPTFKFLKNGKVVGELQGADPAQLEKLVASNK